MELSENFKISAELKKAVNDRYKFPEIDRQCLLAAIFAPEENVHHDQSRRWLPILDLDQSS